MGDTTLKGSTIAASYDWLIVRGDDFSATGNSINLMNNDGVIQASNFHIDPTNDRDGIGTSSPRVALDVKVGAAFSVTSSSTAHNLRLSRDATAGAGNFGGSIAFSAIDEYDTVQAAIAWVQAGGDAPQGGLAFFHHGGPDPTDNILESMRINASGWLGIGTTAPDTTLHVRGDFDGVSTQATTNPNKGLTICKSVSGYGYDDLYGITFTADSANNSDYVVAGVYASPKTVSGSLGGYLHLCTTKNDNSYLVTQMTIDDTGKVGIGTASPAANFHVYSNVSSYGAPLARFEFAHASEGADCVNIKNNGTGTALAVDDAGVRCASLGAAGTGYSGFGVADPDVRLEILDTGTQLKLSYDADTFTSFTVDSAGDFDIATYSNTIITVDSGVSNNFSLIGTPNGDGEAVQLICTATSDGSTTISSFGNIYDTATHDTNKACGFIRLTASDQIVSYFWVDNNNLFRGSTTAAHIGTTSGIAISSALESDERLKVIDSDPFPYGLTEVNKLVPIKYKFKDHKNAVDKLGFGAQTIRPIIPETVQDSGQCIYGYDQEENKITGTATSIAKGNESETTLTMEYHQIIPVLVKAVQELSAKVTALENA